MSCAFGLLLSTTTASAQKAPDAGSLLRDFSRPPLPRPREEAPLELPPQPGDIDTAGPRVHVTAFRIRASALPVADLERLIADYAGRDLTIGDLKSAALKISRYYRDHDLLGRAYVPAQTISDGIVEIDVLESRLGGVSVAPGSHGRFDPEEAAAIIADRARVGDWLHPSDLRDGLAVLNEVPGVLVAAVLRAGTEPSQTQAELTLEDKPLVSGGLRVDNESARGIGSVRALPRLAIEDPFGHGEELATSWLATDAARLGAVALRAPIGASGLMLGVNGSDLAFHLTGPFKALGESGTAKSLGLAATDPIRRGGDLDLTALATLDYRAISDTVVSQALDDRHIIVGTIGLSIVSGAADSLNLSASFGTLDRSAQPSDLAADRLTAKSSGTYAKFDLFGLHDEILSGSVDWLTAFRLQLAVKNLDSSEQISLGGPDGVRAYPVNEADGDDGFIARTDLRWRIAPDFAAYGFGDLGGIILHHDTWRGWQTKIDQRNSYLLAGTGLGFAWSPLPPLQFQGVFARALGGNPGRDAFGRNAAGGRGRNQVWLEASFSY